MDQKKDKTMHKEQQGYYPPTYLSEDDFPEWEDEQFWDDIEAGRIGLGPGYSSSAYGDYLEETAPKDDCGNKLQQPINSNKIANKHIIPLNRSLFKFLLSSKRREEIMGDLFETKAQMIEAGFPMWKVKAVLYFHMLCIMISLFKVRLMDYGQGKKKVRNNHL